MNHQPRLVRIQLGREANFVDVIKAMAAADFQIRDARLIESSAARHIVMSVKFKGRTADEAPRLSGVRATFRYNGMQH
ncbi:hypothetical protein BWU74_18140 [Paraburkholderia caledonica]|nr:hypothetical protein BWU74_18140 [Burkholderia sp. Bk]